MKSANNDGSAGDVPLRQARAMSKARYALLLGLTISVPFLLIAAAELTMRAVHPSDDLALFIPAPGVTGDYLVANPGVARRWFSGIDNPPTPAREIFTRQKGANTFRVFVMGESAAAGFPYPRNGEFSRVIANALRDALPGDSVEVINLGIAATNSFAILDMAKEVAAQHPDAVLIYAGHNEYYGVLGVGSRLSMPGGTAAIRLYLKLLRLRVVRAMRAGIQRVTSRKQKRTDLDAASLMEILARDRQIPIGSPLYRAGTHQFESNLETICRFLRSRGIAVYVGSLASNLKDQPPFAAAANAAPGLADSAFTAGRAALAGGDALRADSLLKRARDLDVVRFRAPSEFNGIIRRIASRTGALYVPVAESFAAASPAGVPGSNIFLEHVHPTRDGQALIGRVFFESMLRSGILGARADTARLLPWQSYRDSMMLTPFDERIAYHTTRTLQSRWPFVPVSRQVDYRGSYIPTSLLDSTAFAVSAGERWEVGKLRVAADYERRQRFDSAAAEYAGLARDAPFRSEPWLFRARALGRAGKELEAEAALRRAVAIQPTPTALNLLAVRAGQRRAVDTAIAYFQQSLAIAPDQPETLYQLSLLYGVSRQIGAARETAMRLSRIAPNDPRLPGLLKALEAAR